METIVLDGARMTSRNALHDYLAAQLGLPAYYGRNLDGLYDLLTERDGPARLVIRGRGAAELYLGRYAGALFRTLEDACQANPQLEVLYENGPIGGLR